MTAPRAEISFGRCDQSLYVRVDGEAGIAACPTVNRLVSEYIAAHQDAPKIILDLEAAEWVDSTFTGWMIQTHRHLEQFDNSSFTLGGLSDACRESLATMGVMRLFRECEVGQPENASKLLCGHDDQPERERAKLMAEAHEALAALSDENARVFGPIAAALRKALSDSQSDSA